MSQSANTPPTTPSEDRIEKLELAAESDDELVSLVAERLLQSIREES